MAIQGVTNIRYVINNDDVRPTPQTSKTFQDAAESYLASGGESRYLERIIEYFEGRPLGSIFPFDIREMAKALFPTAKNATLNRQALTPVRAVINHAYERGWCNLLRLRNFKQDDPKRKVPAPPVWLQLFVRECDRSNLPHVAALVLFMAHTAARVSEAVALEWTEVDLQARTAILLKTKTGRNSTRHLTDELINRLHDMRAQRSSRNPARVFRLKCRYSVNERIAAVCERAGITYKSSHACGRHTFATTAIELGIDITTAMAAGDWKSPAVFLGIYVTPRRNAGRMTADRFNQIPFDTAV